MFVRSRKGSVSKGIGVKTKHTFKIAVFDMFSDNIVFKQTVCGEVKVVYFFVIIVAFTAGAAHLTHNSSSFPQLGTGLL